MNQHQLVQSDPDELFSKSPNVLKYPTIEMTNSEETLKENNKRSVPSNITCHCAACLKPEPPVGSRPIRADIRKFDFKSFMANERTLSNGGFFDVILMDPPWQLAGQAPSRGVSLLYDQLHDKLIEDMEVEVLQRDGLVFIWVINNKFVRALDMMEKWGYKYLMDIAWVKRTVNRKLAKCHGYYLQHAKETCLVGIKGQIDSNILNKVVGSDVIYSERRGQSQKPTEIYEMIEEIFGEKGRFLEIFGRRHNLRSKWTTIGNKRIHFIGLVSDGGVHSHMRHLKSLLKITKKHLESHNVSAFIHAITDGRDTAPRSAKSFLFQDLIPFLKEENFAKLGSVCGRYFAMDRDKRAERTQLAYDAITKESSCELVSIDNLSKVKYADN